ncbi:MAG: hypothetical protein IPM16_16820 [Chloroflexi bacterium]|nr:hypothetical protein [Chloroflexota bacterium]
MRRDLAFVRRKIGVLIVSFFIGCALGFTPAHAASAESNRDLPGMQFGVRSPFLVTALVDAVDANVGDGICLTAGGDCTLRAAVQESNVLGVATIEVTGGSYFLMTEGAAGDADAASGDLDITASITISSNGGYAVLDFFRVQDRAFDLAPGSALTLNGIVIHRAGSPNLNVLEGGGIRSDGGLLTLQNSTIQSSQSNSFGGAIYIDTATLGIYNSALVGNMSLTGSAIYATNAGGLIVNTLITANMINPQNLGSASTGTVYVVQGVPENDIAIIHSTIAGNSAPTYGAGLLAHATGFGLPAVVVANSIISDNHAPVAPDCDMNAVYAIEWQYLNIVGLESFGCEIFTSPNVILGTASLGSPANLGSFFAMASLYPSGASPAVGAGPCHPSVSSDQLGAARPQGTLCDLGAIEVPIGDSAVLDVTSPLIIGQPFTVTLTDSDLVGYGTWNVGAESIGTIYPEGENLVLNETSPGVFSADFTLNPPPTTMGDGNVTAGDGHILIFRTYDSLNDEGQAVELLTGDVALAPTPANQLVNGNFEAGSTGWTISATNGDKVKAKNPFEGANAFLFKGGAGKTKAKFSQTLPSPPVADGDTVIAQAQISSGTSANGSMELSIKTSAGRQTKVSIGFAKNGAYTLHELVVPLALTVGETVTEITLTFSDKSQGGKVYVDAASLTVDLAPSPRATGSRTERTATDPGILPPPAAPHSFRGQN